MGHQIALNLYGKSYEGERTFESDMLLKLIDSPIMKRFDTFNDLV